MDWALEEEWRIDWFKYCGNNISITKYKFNDPKISWHKY